VARVASGVAAVVGGLFAHKNIKVLSLSALLSIEQDLARRRSRFQDLALSAADSPTELQNAQFEEAKESYFNGLDRLAWAVLADYFPDTNMKQDYHEQLTAVIRAYPSDFNVGTHFRNIVKLHKRWDD
jgi:HD-like signal output (HDOD) protein